MTLEIKVGPPQVAIHSGNAVLITAPDGQIAWPTEMGLYSYDTRLISAWSLYANGAEWELLNSGTPTYDLARIYLTNRPFSTETGEIAERTLSLVVSRRIGGGVHEDLDLTNHSAARVCFNLEIVIRSDFADVFEVKQKHIVRRGRITTEWSDARQSLASAYTNQDFRRGLTVTASRSPSPAVYANGRLSFEVALAPGESWHACLAYDLFTGENRRRRRPRNAPIAIAIRPTAGSWRVGTTA